MSSCRPAPCRAGPRSIHDAHPRSPSEAPASLPELCNRLFRALEPVTVALGVADVPSFASKAPQAVGAAVDKDSHLQVRLAREPSGVD
ncbi:hypothetical protein CDD83_618 [Cordyceps sp. RAO-2017]|nr:hypothetical protein CDD83_618 [Cordyceps sp. RAO-2017]